MTSRAPDPLKPFTEAVRHALAGMPLPSGIRLDDLAEPAALAVLAVIYRHPGLLPDAVAAAGQRLGAGVDESAPGLVTRSQMAALRDVHIGTLMTWMARYGDFPEPVSTDGPVPQWWWPDVHAYLERKQLPRSRHADAVAAAAGRDAKILEILSVFPDGLTVAEIADLSGEVGAEDGATPKAVQVRYEDRLRRLEASGAVVHLPKTGIRRTVRPWALADPAS